MDGSQDGGGAQDRDQPYTWGNPKGHLTVFERLHLAALRSRIWDGEYADDALDPKEAE